VNAPWESLPWVDSSQNLNDWHATMEINGTLYEGANDYLSFNGSGDWYSSEYLLRNLFRLPYLEDLPNHLNIASIILDSYSPRGTPWWDYSACAVCDIYPFEFFGVRNMTNSTFQLDKNENVNLAEFDFGHRPMALIWLPCNIIASKNASQTTCMFDFFQSFYVPRGSSQTNSCFGYKTPATTFCYGWNATFTNNHFSFYMTFTMSDKMPIALSIKWWKSTLATDNLEERIESASSSWFLLLDETIQYTSFTFHSPGSLPSCSLTLEGCGESDFPLNEKQLPW